MENSPILCEGKTISPKTEFPLVFPKKKEKTPEVESSQSSSDSDYTSSSDYTTDSQDTSSSDYTTDSQDTSSSSSESEDSQS